MTSSLRIALPALALVAAFPPPGARAEEIVSVYTSVAPSACRKIDSVTEEGSVIEVVFSCPGPAGYVVIVRDADGRTTVSFGPNRAAAEKEPAASRTFTSFNALADTLEWRMVKGRGKPFATIQRFSVSDPETSAAKPVLVVTRLPPGPVCHVATIDVRANGGEANVLARQAADQLARDFRCDRPAEPFGKPGAAHTRLPVP